MSDNPPEESGPEGSDPPDQPDQPDQPEQPDRSDEVAKWKALARKHEASARKGAAAERRLAEIEDANKSEIEKATEAARTWQSKAEQAELRALRAEVAARKGLTASQAKRLQGTSEEELEADADELLAAFKTRDENGNGQSLPPADKAPPRLRPGAVPDAGAVERDPAKLAAQIKRSF